MNVSEDLVVNFFISANTDFVPTDPGILYAEGVLLQRRIFTRRSSILEWLHRIRSLNTDVI